MSESGAELGGVLGIAILGSVGAAAYRASIQGRLPLALAPGRRPHYRICTAVQQTERVSDLLSFSADLPVESVAAGEVLIEEGAPPGRMLVLVSGSVVVEHDGVAFARIDTPGAVFGEVSAVLDRPATATARAASDLEVRVVEDPLVFLTERPGAALAVLRTTASRVDGLTQYLVDIKQQFADAAGHLGLVDQILDQLVHHQGPKARTGSARDPEGDHEHGEE